MKCSQPHLANLVSPLSRNTPHIDLRWSDLDGSSPGCVRGARVTIYGSLAVGNEAPLEVCAAGPAPVWSVWLLRPQGRPSKKCGTAAGVPSYPAAKFIYLKMVKPTETAGRCGGYGLLWRDASSGLGGGGWCDCLHCLLCWHEDCFRPSTEKGGGHWLLLAVASLILLGTTMSFHCWGVGPCSLAQTGASGASRHQRTRWKGLAHCEGSTWLNCPLNPEDSEFSWSCEPAGQSLWQSVPLSRSLSLVMLDESAPANVGEPAVCVWWWCNDKLVAHCHSVSTLINRGPRGSWGGRERSPVITGQYHGFQGGSVCKMFGPCHRRLIESNWNVLFVLFVLFGPYQHIVKHLHSIFHRCPNFGHF